MPGKRFADDAARDQHRRGAQYSHHDSRQEVALQRVIVGARRRCRAMRNQ